MTVPGCWSKADVACPDFTVEPVPDHSVRICVSKKLLYIKKTTVVVTAFQKLIMGNMSFVRDRLVTTKGRIRFDFTFRIII